MTIYINLSVAYDRIYINLTVAYDHIYKSHSSL